MKVIEGNFGKEKEEEISWKVGDKYVVDYN